MANDPTYQPSRPQFSDDEIVEFLLDESVRQRKNGEDKASWMLLRAAMLISGQDTNEGEG